MDGDGVTDYFWVDQEGNGWGYLNRGKGTNVWKALGKIIDDGYSNNRALVHMAIMTDSKRADYIALDEKTGRADWWRNTGADSGKRFEYQGIIADGVADTIKKNYGLKFDVRNVRFAEYVFMSIRSFTEDPANEKNFFTAWTMTGWTTISM